MVDAPPVDAPPDGARVHATVAAWAVRTPQAQAVVWGRQRWTYGQLAERVGQLVALLHGAGVGRDDVVAVCLDRGGDVVASALAVLRVGAGYALLDPSAGDGVLRPRLAELGPTLIVTENAHRVRVSDVEGAPVLCLDDLDDLDDPDDPEDPDDPVTGSTERAGVARAAVEVRPEDVACVLYTSGSTGPAKQAWIEHRNLEHAASGWQEVYRIRPADRVLSTVSPQFDSFTGDWVRALTAGATLVIARRDYAHDPRADLADLVTLAGDEAVTVLELNTQLARRLLPHLAGTGTGLGRARLLTVGGDRWYLDEQLAAAETLGPDVRILNVYGVAEATIDACYLDLKDLQEPAELLARGVRCLVGRPFPGVVVDVVDGAGQPVPDGEVGQVRIGGGGVGRGQRRDGATEPGHPARQLTGDLGRRVRSAGLEIIGRADAGFAGISAVDVAAIEAALRAHPEVAEAVVADSAGAVPAHPDRGPGRPRPGRAAASRPVGYVVPVPGASPDLHAVAAALRSVPVGAVDALAVLDRVVIVPVLPRDRSGAIDRSRLPRHPTLPVGVSGGGKAARWTGADVGLPTLPGMIWAGLAIGVIARFLTGVLWPGSTDTSLVPMPWKAQFQVLYLAECASFGVGLVYLLRGRARLLTLDRPPALTWAAHLSIAWLLLVWWPEDNFYRLASPTDWPVQAALTYGFNITSMIAALVVVAFACRPEPAPPG